MENTEFMIKHDLLYRQVYKDTLKRMPEMVFLVDLNNITPSELTPESTPIWTGKILGEVKQAVAYQISREMIRSRNMIQLKLEHALARIKWAYNFVDSSLDLDEQPRAVGTPLQSLSFAGWRQFEKDFAAEVKCRNKTTLTQNDSKEPLSAAARISNLGRIMDKVIANLRQDPGRKKHIQPEVKTTLPIYPKLDLSKPAIFLFTPFPKQFNGLVHYTHRMEGCKLGWTEKNNGLNVPMVQIVLVDLQFHTTPDGGALKAHCPRILELRFWDELQMEISAQAARRDEDAEEEPKKDLPVEELEGAVGGAEVKEENSLSCSKDVFSLKLSCMRKIVFMVKLEELCHPWKYDKTSKREIVAISRLMFAALVGSDVEIIDPFDPESESEEIPTRIAAVPLVRLRSNDP